MEINDKGCSVCGKEKKFAQADTCSRECSNVLKRKKAYENRICPVCSTQFEERIKRKRRFCSEPCRLDWQTRPENIAFRMERTKEAVMEKYGVDSTFKVDEIQRKASESMRKTMNEHGKEITEKIKNTKQRRYGDEAYNNMSKNRETKLVNHGDENYNNRDKAVQTMMDEYGVPYAIQREDFQEKQRNTNKERYGYEYPFQSREVMEEMKKLFRERYGVDNVSQSMENKIKVTRAWQERISSQKQYLLFSKLEENGLKILDEFTGINKPNYEREESTLKEYRFQCLACDHEFSRTYANWEIPICRRCHPVNTNPSTHDLIRSYLNDKGIMFTENDRRFLENRKELDFLIPDHGLAIEVNGNLFHSEIFGGKDKQYHLEKTKICHGKSMRLIHIFEDEIKLNPETVMSRLSFFVRDKNLFSVGSRECEIGRLEDKKLKRSFYEDNHLQGSSNSNHDIGLWHNKELVALMSFSVPRRALGSIDPSNRTFELIRFCNKRGYNVNGAFSRLFSFFVKDVVPNSILTFADVRWSGYDPDKTVYAKNGFKFDGFTPPNYWYFEKNDYMTRYHRFRFRKDILVKKAVEVGMVTDEEQAKLFTEWELAQLLGMDRIWDCGNMKFSWTRT